MPQEVKQVLRNNMSPVILNWANKQVKLKRKLDACREK